MKADGVKRALLPFQRHAAVGKLTRGQRHVRYRRKPPLDLRHAPGATDAFNGKIDVLQAELRPLHNVKNLASPS